MHPHAQHFVDHETEFHLGSLVTEQPHPYTRSLSAAAKADPVEGMRQLIEVDRDVTAMLRQWCGGPQPRQMAEDVYRALMDGGHLFFTGCGATGRLSILLDAVWRRFWQELREQESSHAQRLPDLEDGTRSVMAGGDFALIKSVEGYEDSLAFGRRQITDMNVGVGDVVFAITEGGETSFVIGTAQAAADAGAKVYFVYNNPDHVLSRIERSRRTLEDERMTNVCLATGPMAITGSTRMQATTAEEAALLLVLELVLDRVISEQLGRETARDVFETVCEPAQWPERFEQMRSALAAPENLGELARLAVFERDLYSAGGLLTYVADRYALDLLTDTTERSPTFLIPPFRKVGDEASAPSWSYVVTREETPKAAWRCILRRDFNDVRWSRQELREMLGADNRLVSDLPRIDRNEILKFDISHGRRHDRLRPDHPDRTLHVTVGTEPEPPLQPRTPRLFVGSRDRLELLPAPKPDFAVGLPEDMGCLRPMTHLAFKMCMNAVSTLTMAFMDRVLGNVMVWVSPSNKKLYDRASRYVAQLSGRPYAEACDAVFQTMDDLRPRLERGEEVPAPVLVATVRLLSGASTAKVEHMLAEAAERDEEIEDLLARLGT